MFKFFPQVIILVCVMAVIIIIARRVPTLEKVSIDQKKLVISKKSFFGRVIEGSLKFSLGVVNLLASIFRRVKKEAKILKKEQAVAEQHVQKEVKELVQTSPAPEKIQITSNEEIIKMLESASVLFGGGNYKKAESVYIEIIKKDAKNIFAYKGLGRLYWKQGSLGDAKASFQEVIKIDPKDQEALSAVQKISAKEMMK